MHHLNCLVLESLVNALPLSPGQSVLTDAFSNSADECLLVFDHFSISCRFIQGEVYFFSSDSPVSKSRLFKPLFRELHGKTLTELQAHPFERSFHFSFGNSTLLFKCHGRKSNLILYQPDESPEIFRKNIEQDENTNLENAFRRISPPYLPDALADESLFKSSYPYLPIEIREDLKNLDEKAFFDRLEALQHSPDLSYHSDNFDIRLLPDSKENHFLENLNRFGASASRQLIFQSLKSSLLGNCNKTLHEKERFLKANEAALETLVSKRPDSEIGHIILSNLHLIKPQMKEAVLFDIYRNENIRIGLDPELSAVENAERYFRKEKGLPHKIELLRTKVDSAKHELETLQQQLLLISKASDLRSLKPLLREKKNQTEDQQLPYRKFVLDGYEIYVGKHADSNEKLLNYYSDKNDWWLHAKDVSGSHVIVRSQGKATLPENILEKAASLAAYYSKNRKQSLVTVTYTLRKFVRKIKGADKGKVTVSNERSVLVPPADPSDFQA